MTQDEIIEMAGQAGFTPFGQRRLLADLEVFARLVAGRYEEPLRLALAELYRHAIDTESGDRAIDAVEGVLK
jgi:hypothetical protein